MRRRDNPIRRTTGKGGNYRPTKSGAGMTAKGVRAYRAANPGSKLKSLSNESLPDPIMAVIKDELNKRGKKKGGLVSKPLTGRSRDI